jgi:hypothetical protein
MDIKRIQKNGLITGWLRNQLARFGFMVNRYPKLLTDEDDVYGIYAGVQEQNTAVEIRVLLPGTPWAISDAMFVSSFTAGTLYTLDEVNNGDVIELIRDATVYRYKVVNPRTIGTDKVLVTMFQLSPLG